MVGVEGGDGIGKRDELRAREGTVAGDLALVEHLRNHLQRALDVIAHVAALDLVAGVVPAEVAQIGQSPEVHGLDELCAGMVIDEIGG